MKIIKKIINDLLTGKDNKTFDLGRVSWVLCNFVLIIFAIHTEYEGGNIDILTLTQALTLITTSHGVVIWAKKETEPST